MRSWNGSTKKVKPIFKNLGEGESEVVVNRQSKVNEYIEQGGEIAIAVEVGEEDIDVVVVKLA